MSGFKNLPKFWKFIIIVMLVVIMALIVLNIFMVSLRKQTSANRKTLVKADSDLIGVRFAVPREKKDDVKVNLYIPENSEDEKFPVIFNIHGGGFVGGDADVLDTQSDRISADWNAIVVTINYTKADVKPIEYGVDEVVDTIKYFRDHSEEYNADTQRFAVIGYSAGAYYASTAAIKLEKDGVPLAAQVLCYPFTTFLDKNEVNENVASALFVLASEDPISQGSKSYEEYLRANGVTTEIKEYDGAGHSFIESNNPEGDHDFASDEERNAVINPTQEALARQAESDIIDWLNELWG